MKKTIVTVFMIIGVLVLGLIVWALFFNDGGVLQTGWNAVADQVNTTWRKLTGDNNSQLITNWNSTGSTVQSTGNNIGGGTGGSGNNGNSGGVN